MEREELFEKVTGELGESKLTLSERTINEELDDMLEEFGDDDEANQKLVVRIANRLRRMDGNLHADVSQQVKAYKNKLKPKADPKPSPKGDDDENDEVPAWFKKFSERFEASEAERKADREKQEKAALVKAVKDGLKAKFADAGMTVNDFFINTAIAKVQFPTENASVQTLVGELEKHYNADLKAAGIEQNDSPMTGGGGGNGKGSKSVDDYFARKAKKEGWKKN